MIARISCQSSQRSRVGWNLKRVAMIQFPFWLLTPTADRRRLPVAFSSVDRMGEYLKAQTHGEWAVQLVNRYSVAEVLAHLHETGLTLIHYDVDRHGNGGTEITLEQIRAAANGA